MVLLVCQTPMGTAWSLVALDQLARPLLQVPLLALRLLMQEKTLMELLTLEKAGGQVCHSWVEGSRPSWDLLCPLVRVSGLPPLDHWILRLWILFFFTSFFITPCS